MNEEHLSEQRLCTHGREKGRREEGMGDNGGVVIRSLDQPFIFH